MIEPRISQRMLKQREVEQEKQRLAEQERLVEEAENERNLLLRLEEYSLCVSEFFNNLLWDESGCATPHDDFDLPAEWKSASWLDEAPSFRNLKQNLYRPPLQRPPYNPTDDAPICSCSASDGCGENCHNRNVFMSVCSVAYLFGCSKLSPQGVRPGLLPLTAFCDCAVQASDLQQATAAAERASATKAGARRKKGARCK